MGETMQIPQLSEQSFSQFGAWLAQQEGSACHLLFDPILRPLEDDDLLAVTLAPFGKARHCVHLPPQSFELAQQPWIQAFDAHGPQGRQALHASMADAQAELAPHRLLHGMGRRIGGWLFSSHSVSVMAAHLSRVMIQRAPHGQLMLLRLTDPAVVWALFSLLNNEQRTTLLGPIQHWWLLDPAGRAAHLVNPELSHAEAASANLSLSPEQWKHLLRLDALNATLNRWVARQRLESVDEEIPLDETAQRALQALHRADQWGLDDDEDLASFTWHALTVHPRFDEHPGMQALLKKCRTASRTDAHHYTALCDELDPAQWASIRAIQE
jgi:hypothetical protein